MGGPRRTWPQRLLIAFNCVLVAACLAVSWWVIRRSLPPGHPGLRHPDTGAVTTAAT